MAGAAVELDADPIGADVRVPGAPGCAEHVEPKRHADPREKVVREGAEQLEVLYEALPEPVGG